MGLVRYALKFRISFYVLAILMLLCGAGAAIVAPKDVLPEVDIPVVVVVWTYNGLDATEMSQRVTTYTEFSLSNNVNNIRRMESTTLQGTAVERIYFDASVSIDLAITQVVSAMNSIQAVLPPGIQPPVVLRFSASSVPVIQLSLTSAKDSLTSVFNYAQYFIRQRISEVPGSTLPQPFGAAPRQIMVDLDLDALYSRGLTPLDVTNAMSAQNLTVPSGLAKIGEQQYPVRLNATPEMISVLNDAPVRTVDGQAVLMRDVAHVRDGAPPQLNFVRTDGQESVLMQVLKNGDASTLSVVDNVKGAMAAIRAAAPEGMKIELLFDQSVFVSAAIRNVVEEATIAAVLTGLTILLFLGSWRSTLIVLVSIPLSILTSLAVLAALGETINILTLGGLALSVGILVDDATVAIENTYRLFEARKPFREAVVEGAATIAKPALISTLAICSAFVSVFFLADTPRYLFIPQALAVVFAMLTSYLLSRTLVPILIDVLVAPEYRNRFEDGGEQAERPRRTRFGRVFAFLTPVGRLAKRFRGGFEARFARFHRGYVGLLHVVIRRRAMTLLGAGVVAALAGCLFPFVGQDYFPQIEASQMTLHMRTRPGMRIETAAQVVSSVEQTIRETIPEDELGLVLSNVGLPSTNYNFAFMDASFVAYNDGQILINLKEGHRPASIYTKALRERLRERFPDVIFYFQPADIITQILNFGTIAQIDVQVSGRDKMKDLDVAQSIVRRLSEVPGAVDVHLHQIVDVPQYFVDVDRQRASEIGLTAEQVAQNVNISLSGSFQVTPNFWTDPKSGIPYQLWVQTPEWRNTSMADIENLPLFVTADDAAPTATPPAAGATASASGATTAGSTGAATGTVDSGSTVSTLASVATLKRVPRPAVVNHVNTQGTYDVLANVQDADLGSVRKAVDAIVAEEGKDLKAPDRITVRGQVESMDTAFLRMEIGLGISLVAVYLLMAVNFQSWGDPFVVLCALPLAFCGIVLSLFVTGTTFSIPSLFGAIMSVGVASANSILLVTFAKEHREETGCSAAEAAIAAGETRLRPVLMTAGAMFIGLLPMAIGGGEGSEQNAALARAVLGGIAVGTGSTLLFVPFLYTLIRRGEAKPLEDYA